MTLDEEFPRLQVMRGPKRKGVRYFGPYAHAWAIRETLDLLLRVFPARTCSRRRVQARRPDRPAVPARLHRQVLGARASAGSAPTSTATIVEDFCDFMAGQTDDDTCAGSRGRCRPPAANQEFERAARLRDDIGALRRAMEKQAVVLGDGTDADVVAFAEDELEAAVQVFHVRGGRVRGQRGWVVDKVEDLTHRRPGRALPPADLRRAGQRADAPGCGDSRARARCWCRRCRRTPTRCSDWLTEAARQPRATCGCRSAATSGR